MKRNEKPLHTTVSVETVRCGHLALRESDERVVLTPRDFGVGITPRTLFGMCSHQRLTESDWAILDAGTCNVLIGASLSMTSASWRRRQSTSPREMRTI